MKRLYLPALGLVVILLVILVSPVFGQTTYVIQPGDTLYSIARRYGVSVQAIAAANNIVNPNLIYAGQSLVIPGQTPPGGDGSAPPPVVTLPPPVTGGTTYVVKPGDTLFRIAISHGVTVAALVQANGLTNPNIIYAGQVLTIPGGSGQQPPAPQPTPGQTPVPPPQPTAVPPPAGVNLLPNISFEGGYYHLYGAPELQVPNSWQFDFVEGQGAAGTGITLIRPESRALPRWLLPPQEHDLFIWSGDWTVKVFKGGSPISFRLFTDVYLQPGTYRFTAGYFPDLVASYSGNQKSWASQAAAGEVAFIKDGVGGYSAVTVGTRNTLVQTFSVPSAANVRVGVAFRTRYNLANNGFFMDDWSLLRVAN